MKQKEIMAAIQQLKDTVANVQCEIAALEELVANENHQEETPDETPVSNVPIIEDEVEDITLPDPPAEVHIDIPENAPDEDAKLGCAIITSLPDFYNGKCSVLKVHKRYFDNGQPKLFIDIYHVVIEAYDANMKQIGSYTTHWNNLSKFHTELLKRGINTHDKKNWKPKTLLFDLD